MIGHNDIKLGTLVKINDFMTGNEITGEVILIDDSDDCIIYKILNLDNPTKVVVKGDKPRPNAYWYTISDINLLVK